MRNHTCSTCASSHAVLPQSTFIAAVRNKRIQFWGDSVSSQMECDFRFALNELIEPVPNGPCRVKRCGAAYPALNASVEYWDTGCPYSCMYNKYDGSIQETETVDELLQRAKSATHVVFNLGGHYEGYDTANRSWVRYASPQIFHRTLGHFWTVLSRLQKGGTKVILRSTSHTHFSTKDGYMDVTSFRMPKHHRSDPTRNWCVPSPPSQTLHFTEVEMRKLARALGSPYFDVLGLSDDASMHPDFHGARGKGPARPFKEDCRHFCQNCAHRVRTRQLKCPVPPSRSPFPAPSWLRRRHVPLMEFVAAALLAVKTASSARILH